MSNSLPVPFPYIDVSADHNPGIRLFGKRFISEQSLVEYLVEFLALVHSDKWVADREFITTPLPTPEELQNWPQGKELNYKLPVKLNLKLFAFLSSSRVDTRHETHKGHYRSLIEQLNNKININSGNKQDVIDRLEQFFRGYHGAGANRTWCAQTFFPISSSLITQETIWNESISRREPPLNWYESIVRFQKYYSVSKHRFMARGGELLYLQLCNLFSINPDTINKFTARLDLHSDETNLASLHQSIQENFMKLNKGYMSAFDRLVHFIDSMDRETQELTNKHGDGLSCEWCPSESWPEGYLFAVEISRLLGAALDPVERLELLMTGCALQVLRSLCAQSVRYTIEQNGERGSVLGYAWVFSPSNMPSRQQKLASQRNLQFIKALIQKALPFDKLVQSARQSPTKTEEQLYREADNKYGHKLFLSLGKKLGIIAPYTGPGARFIMTDSLLRYLVTVLIRPGERCTYDDFLRRLYLHYGIAVEGETLIDSLFWSELPANSSVQPVKGSWLTDMLRAGGFLTELSDACSIVSNPFS